MSNKFFIKYNSVICYNTVDNFHFSYTLIVQKNLFIISLYIFSIALKKIQVNRDKSPEKQEDY